MSKKMKYLNIHLTNHVQEMYVENQDRPKYIERYTMFMEQKTHDSKYVIQIYRFNVIDIKIPTKCFINPGKIVFKCI